MKVLILLIALIAGLCFACKNIFDHSTELIAQRQQLLASAAVQEAPTQSQAIYTL